MSKQSTRWMTRSTNICICSYKAENSISTFVYDGLTISLPTNNHFKKTHHLKEFLDSSIDVHFNFP